MSDGLPSRDGRELPEELRGESGALSNLLLELATAPARDPSALAPSLAPGKTVGRFELLREVGRGGFGVVFEARDTELGRLVAFKAMRASRASGQQLEKPLREEAEAAARLNHPNVVTLHDYGLHEGTPYLILELLRGETLQQRLRRGPLDPREAVAIALDVARGLVHAHAQGVLHRDLKPGNVFLCAGGGTKILDFGLARLLDRASLAGGTPAYMAPEQLRGEPGDARADVFSLAVVLFHALAGALPFPVVDGRTTVVDPGPPPSLPLDDAPPELAALLAGALSKDPAGRPQSAAAFLSGLEDVLRAYAGRETARLLAERRHRLRRAAALGAVVAIAIAAVATVAAIRARTTAEHALRASRVASAAESASDPLVAALLMAELRDDAPARAVEIAQKVLAQPIPTAVLEPARGGYGLEPSPDGTLVAAGIGEGGVALFRADGAGAPLLLRGGGKRTNAVAFTPDGTRIISAAHDGDVRVWPVDGERDPITLHTGDSPLSALRAAPDGLRAAVSALDGRVWILTLDGSRPPRALLHDAAVLALAWSPSGDRLATASLDGHVRVYDRGTGGLLWSQGLEGGAMFSLAWSPDGRTIVVASEDGVARLLSAGGRGVRALGEHDVPLASVAFSPDGTRVALASHDGSVRLREVRGVEGKEREVRLQGPRVVVRRAVFDPSGTRVLTLSNDGTARLVPADGDGAALAFRGHWVIEATFSPDGTHVYTRGTDGAVRVWRADDPRERGVLRGHEMLVDTVEWTRDGKRLVTSGHDGTARIWPVHGGEGLVVRDPGRILHSADLDPAEKLLVTASEDGAVRLWDARSGELLRTFGGHDGAVLSAVFSPDGAWIASGALDRTVRVWRTDGTGEPLVLHGHEGGVTSVSWAPGGDAIVSASQLDATVRVWPLGCGAPTVLKAERGVFRATVTPDGTKVIVAENEGALRVFSLASLEELPAPAALTDGLFSAAVSPDGRRLALTSHDGTVRVYPMTDDGESLVLRGHDAGVGDAAFSPDGAELATAAADGTARVWTVAWDRLLAQLRGATTACLPATHRVQLLGEPPDDAEARVSECHRAAGREPPVTHAAPESPAASNATPAARAAKGG